MSNLARLYIFSKMYSTRIDNHLQHWFVHGDDSIDSVISMIAQSFDKVIRGLIQADLIFADYEAVEYNRAISEKWGKLLVRKTWAKTRFKLRLHRKYTPFLSHRKFLMSRLRNILDRLRWARMHSIRYSANLKTALRANCACKAEFHGSLSIHTHVLCKYKMAQTNKGPVLGARRLH